MRTPPSLFVLAFALTASAPLSAQEVPAPASELGPREQASSRPAGERAHAEERPFVFTLDPSTPTAGDVTAEYAAGVTSGVAAERPLPSSLAHPGLVHAATVGFGATARLAPFLTGKVLQPTEIGPQAGSARAGAGGGLRWQVTRPGAPLRFALAGAGQREFGGVWVLWARAAVSYDVARVRVAGNLQAEKALARGRDEIDLMMTAGVSYRAIEGLRVGAEYVAQDLEGLVDREEAEGGARHFAGPTLALDLGGGRAQFVVGPAFGLTQQSPRLLGRAAMLFAF